MSSLIAFNKPFNVISQFSPHEKYETLKTYIHCPNIYPAGRLDSDSEGLLLLTDNGSWQAKISAPHFKMAKTYWAQVEGDVSDEALNQLKQGVMLKDGITQPALKCIKLETPETLWARHPPIRERKSIPTSWLALTITEGRNRQVRRMCAAVGFPCLRLIRVQIGEINLFDLSLSPGEWSLLNAESLFASSVENKRSSKRRFDRK